MDAQFWIYIIIGVIYFLSRLLKKPEEVPAEQPENQRPEKRRIGQPVEATSERPRQLTFEELLREITEGKQTQSPPPPPVPRERKPRFEKVDEQVDDEAQSLERVDFDEAEGTDVFQKYKETNTFASQRQSLEETLRLEDTVVDFKRFAAFERKEKRNVLEDYLKIIRDPQKLKHAVVMSEILKRKF